MAAFAFEHIGGMAPCSLCIWQRWPHVAALLGLASPLLGWTKFALIGAAGSGLSGVIGIYHTGVERAWWEGPSTCSAMDISGLTAEQLLERILAAPVVRCDQVPWEMLGLSMASWNAVASFGLAGLWLTTAWNTINGNLVKRTGP